MLANIDHGKNVQIIILGMHRSGTSVITHLLHEMGAHVGGTEELLDSMVCNPVGFWERKDVEAVNEALLSSFNAAWDMPCDVNFGDLSPKAERDFLQGARPIVDALNAHKPWTVKDPRFSLLLPQWLPLLDAPVAVICWRHPVEVARSLKCRDGFPTNYGLALWEWYTVAALRASEGMPRVFVSYNDLMKDAPKVAMQLYQECLSLGVSGLHALSDELVETIISPNLYRERATTKTTDLFLNARQSELMNWLAAPEDAYGGSVSEGACETLASVGGLLRELKATNQRTVAANAGLARARARTLKCMHWMDGLSYASDVLLGSLSWRVGQYIGKTAGVLSRTSGSGPDRFMKMTANEYRNWKRPRDLNVIAILATYNEEALIAACLTSLIAQGVSVYLIDNESTDRTVEIARQFEGRGLIGIETLHRRGHFSLMPQLQRKEALVRELDGDWFMHVDADELRFAPSGYASFPEAFAAIEEQGCNAAEFMEYTFVATQEHPQHSPETFQETMQWYYPFLPFKPHRINAWKRQDGPVDLQSSGGHQVIFPGRHVSSERFILKHYTYLSRERVIEKYVNNVFDPAEINMNVWQRKLTEADVVLPSEQALRRFTENGNLDASEPRDHRFIAEAVYRSEAEKGIPPT